jgi:hypothetical protein
LQRTEGESRSTRDGFLFSSFILLVIIGQQQLAGLIAHYHLNTRPIIHRLLRQAKFVDQFDVFVDDVKGALDGKGGFLSAHAPLDGGKVDASKIKNIVIDGFGAMAGFLGNKVGRLAFQIGLAADDAPVGDSSPQVVEVSSTRDDFPCLGFVLPDQFGDAIAAVVEQDAEVGATSVTNNCR